MLQCCRWTIICCCLEKTLLMSRRGSDDACTATGSRGTNHAQPQIRSLISPHAGTITPVHIRQTPGDSVSHSTFTWRYYLEV